MNFQGAVAGILCGNQLQHALAVGTVEHFLLVTGLDILRVRNDPYLEKMRDLVRQRIVLAVTDAGTGTHPLDFARSDLCAGADGILVFQRAFENVGNDFHVLVPMGRESFTGLNTIFVDDAQRAEIGVVGVDEVTEGKCMFRIQPAQVHRAAVFCMTNVNHRGSPSKIMRRRSRRCLPIDGGDRRCFNEADRMSVLTEMQR